MGSAYLLASKPVDRYGNTSPPEKVYGRYGLHLFKSIGNYY